MFFFIQVGTNAQEYDEAPLNLVASHVPAAEETHWPPPLWYKETYTKK